MSETATVACLAGDGAQLDLPGVADPAGTLPAASLLLAARPGQRSAERTLERAVAAEITMNRTQSKKTRSFADAVIGRASRRADRPRALRGGRTMSRMLGSDAILRCLEAEGVEVMFGIPGGAILPTYDAIARGTTVRHVLARHEQGAGHMAEGYARASGKVGVAMATSGPGATNLVTPIADAWMDSTPIVVHHRPGAVEPDRHRRVPGDRRDRDHDADRQALVARPGRARAAAGDEERVPRRAQRPAGPRARRHREGRAGGRVRLLVPGRGRHARLEAADEGARAADPRGGEGDRRVEAADRLRRRRRAQRERVGRAARAGRDRRLARGRDADGQGLPARLAPAQLRHARHARLEVRELGAQQVRPDHRGRRALRRPRHRQGLGVRAGREGDPLRHRRGRGREDPPRGDPGRRARSSSRSRSSRAR